MNRLLSPLPPYGMPRSGNPLPVPQHKQPSLELISIQALLDDVHERLSAGEGHEALENLFWGLRDHRIRATEAEWRSLVQFCLNHPLRSMIHADPFTYRAFTKPRGYAGDAELIDFIYGVVDGKPIPSGLSAVG